MNPKIWIAIIAVVVIGFVGGQIVKRFLEIDSCLDHGGSWNYEGSYCDSAEEFAVQFINSYVTYCNDLSQTTQMVEWFSSRTDVTDKFKNDLKKLVDQAEENDPELGLGFDPIFDAQDYPEEGFKLDKAIDIKGNVTVSGKNEDNYKLLIRVVARENKWLVDGIGSVRMPEQN